MSKITDNIQFMRDKNAETVDSLDSTDFALVNHNHNGVYANAADLEGYSRIELFNMDLETNPTVVLASWDASVYRSAKYIVQMYNKIEGYYSITEVLLIHDDVDAYHTEYGKLETSPRTFIKFRSAYNSVTSTVELKAKRKRYDNSNVDFKIVQILNRR